MKQRSSRTSQPLYPSYCQTVTACIYLCVNITSWMSRAWEEGTKIEVSKKMKEKGTGKRDKVKWNNVKTICEMTVSLYRRHLRAFRHCRTSMWCVWQCSAVWQLLQYNRYDNDILKMRWEMKKKQQQIASNIPNDWPVNRLVVYWGLRIGNT